MISLLKLHYLTSVLRNVYTKITKYIDYNAY